MDTVIAWLMADSETPNFVLVAICVASVAAFIAANWLINDAITKLTDASNTYARVLMLITELNNAVARDDLKNGGS